MMDKHLAWATEEPAKMFQTYQGTANYSFLYHNIFCAGVIHVLSIIAWPCSKLSLYRDGIVALGGALKHEASVWNCH